MSLERLGHKKIALDIYHYTQEMDPEMNPIPIEMTPLSARDLLNKIFKNQDFDFLDLNQCSIRWEIYPPIPDVPDGHNHPKLTAELKENTLLIYLGNLQYQFPDEPSSEDRLTVDLINIKKQLEHD